MSVRLCAAAVVLLSACAGKRPAPPEDAVRLHRQCGEALAAAEYEDARLFCQGASGQAPQFAEAWQDLGVALLSAGKTAEAADPLEKARALDDRLWRAHNGLGIVAFVAGEHGKAEGHFKRAVELKPDAAEPRYNRAWNFFRGEKLREAREELRTVVRQHPSLGHPAQFLGIVLLTEGRVAEGIEAMVEAIAREPGQCRNWLGMGNAYAADRRHEEAMSALLTCVELCPADPVCGAAVEHLGSREAVPLATPRDLIP